MSSARPTAYQPLLQNTEHHELDDYYPPSASYKSKPSSSSGYKPRVVDLPFTRDDIERHRGIARTPSPTPSESKALKGGIDWAAMKSWRYWVRKEMIVRFVVISVIVALYVLVSVFEDPIVDTLKPAAKWLKARIWGPAIPVAVMIVLSFPPLFGADIVHLLCGLVWGPWIGFAIVVVGTYLGEVANFLTFKLLCTSRAEKQELKSVEFGCMAKVIRDGGFWIALVVRYTAMPAHFVTCIFSVTGMSIWTFSAAALLSMPKQLFSVYVGSTLESDSDGLGEKSSKKKIISTSILGLTILITIVAVVYINRKLRQVRPDVIYKRRKARQAKLASSGLLYDSNTSDTSYNVSFNNQQDAAVHAPKPKYLVTDSDLESSMPDRQMSMEADIEWDVGRHERSQARQPSFPPPPGLGLDRPKPTHSPEP